MWRRWGWIRPGSGPIASESVLVCGGVAPFPKALLVTSVQERGVGPKLHMLLQLCSGQNVCV